MGDTRLVAVISTRIGCGVSDAIARWLSHGWGLSDVLHLAPNALDCGEQRGPGCRCPLGR